MSDYLARVPVRAAAAASRTRGPGGQPGCKVTLKSHTDKVVVSVARNGAKLTLRMYSLRTSSRPRRRGGSSRRTEI